MNPDSPILQNKPFRIHDNFYRIIAALLIVAGLLIFACIFFSEPSVSAAKNTSPPNKLQNVTITKSNSKQERLTIAAIIRKDSVKKKVNQTTAAKADSIERIKTELDVRKDYWMINGTRGDFTAGIVGTVFSLAGFIYLLLSFKQQRDANQLQVDAFEHDKIETRFFELIKLHRDNVNELSFSYKTVAFTGKFVLDYEVVEHEYTQRQVFQAIKDHFDSAYDELSPLFTSTGLDGIYEQQYLAELKKNETLKTRGIDLKRYAEVDLLYLIVFFGVSANGRKTIESFASEKYRDAFVKKLLAYAALKPKADSAYFVKWLSIKLLSNQDQYFDRILEKREKQEAEFEELKPQSLSINTVDSKFDPYYPDNYEKYYGGHQFRLGHYFRHLYQSVSFINKLERTPGEQQRDWVKHLRGQLSTPEQILFFLNSLSQLGRIWELEDTKTGGVVSENMRMVTNYKLIKNIPNDVIHRDIKLSEFYPGIVYEGFVVPQKEVIAAKAAKK